MKRYWRGQRIVRTEQNRSSIQQILQCSEYKRRPTASTSSSSVSFQFHFQHTQIVYLITYHKRWHFNINYFISFVYTFIAPQFTLNIKIQNADWTGGNANRRKNENHFASLEYIAFWISFDSWWVWCSLSLSFASSDLNRKIDKS